MTVTLPATLRVELLREMLPEGWAIVREGEGTEAPMDEHQAAEWLKTSVHVLRRHRTNGDGPAFRKIGRNPVYMAADLLEWVQGIKAQKHTAA